MMCELLVEGGERLYGELTIQGSKTAYCPFWRRRFRAGHLPHRKLSELRDVDASVAILRHLGCCTYWGRTVRSWSTQRAWTRCDVPDALMREMRSSVIFLGAIWRAARKRRSVIPAAASWGRVPLTCT